MTNPLVVGAGPLCDDLDTARALEDNGAAMLVLRSLFEEEITNDQLDAFYNVERHSDSFAEASSFEPDSVARSGRTNISSTCRREARGRHPGDRLAQRRTPGGWISYAGLIEQAGADGLELHIYHAASDMTMTAADVERQFLDILRDVKAHASTSRSPSRLRRCRPRLPISPEQLDTAGADGLVLFTRFQRADIDIEELEVVRIAAAVGFLRADAALARRGGAVGPVRASIALTRRRPHRDRRHQGDDGRRARDADGIGAAAPRPGHLLTVRARASKRGCASTSGARSTRCAAT